jgi:hypothetical protein
LLSIVAVTEELPQGNSREGLLFLLSLPIFRGQRRRLQSCSATSATQGRNVLGVELPVEATTSGSCHHDWVKTVVMAMKLVGRRRSALPTSRFGAQNVFFL